MNIIDTIKAVQREVGVKDDGIAGPKTWAAIYNRIMPPSKIVVSAEPILDGRSEQMIATLLPPVQPYARALVSVAHQAGIDCRIISGTRTYAEQDALYQQGRSNPGKIVTNAKPGFSWHNHGVAFDVGIFRDGDYLEEGREYVSVGALGKAVGLEWGGDWTSIQDEPHFQFPNGKSLGEARLLHDLGKNVFTA